MDATSCRHLNFGACAQEVCESGGRGAGQVPPARRLSSLRRPGAHGAGLLDARPSGMHLPLSASEQHQLKRSWMRSLNNYNCGSVLKETQICQSSSGSLCQSRLAFMASVCGRFLGMATLARWTTTRQQPCGTQSAGCRACPQQCCWLTWILTPSTLLPILMAPRSALALSQVLNRCMAGRFW